MPRAVPALRKPERPLAGRVILLTPFMHPPCCDDGCLVAVSGRRAPLVGVLHRTEQGSERYSVSEDRLMNVEADIWGDALQWIHDLHEGRLRD